MNDGMEKERCSIDALIFISAMCLFLSAVEYAIPKPLPFLRLGLANLPIIIFLKKIRLRDLFLIIIFKVLGQGMISGTLFSYIFIFSLTGSFSSGLTMYAIYRLFFKNGAISNIGLSLFGAMANCLAQLICAYFIMFGANTLYIVPLMLVFSSITGFLLVLFCNYFENKSKWLREIDLKSIKISEKKEIPLKNKEKDSKIIAIISLIMAIIFIVLLIFIRKNIYIWSMVALFFIIHEIRKKGKVNLIAPILTLIFIVFFSLLTPYGLVLLNLGFIKITQGALESGLRKSGILLGMTFCSQLILTFRFNFTGKVGGRIKQFFNCYGFFTQSADKGKKIKYKGLVQFLDEHLQGITNQIVIEGREK